MALANSSGSRGVVRVISGATLGMRKLRQNRRDVGLIVRSRGDVSTPRRTMVISWSAIWVGLAPGLDPSILRMLCFGAMNWSISWYDPQGASPTQIADQLMTMVRRGVLASPDDRPTQPKPQRI